MDAPSQELYGYNVTWHGEDTRIVASDALTVSVNTDTNGRPTGGSHFLVSAINNLSGGESLIVFYQRLGNGESALRFLHWTLADAG